MYSIKANKGFAVLALALLLSFAGILFTANMVVTQLLDNRVVANYYRNNEAFVNAQSGINLILSRIAQSNAILGSLPLTYQPSGSYYRVDVQQLNKNTLLINSLGRSKDGRAKRTIQLQVYHEAAYNIPVSALASNGKLNLGALATIDEGCAGLTAINCKSPGNRAKYQLLSDPSKETQRSDCTGAKLGQNHIDQAALYTAREDNHFLLVGEPKIVTDEFGHTEKKITQWPATQPLHAEFFGTATDRKSSPTTLFESTFGVAKEIGTSVLQTSVEVLTIDMTSGSAMNCSHELKHVSDDINTIYIKGDCNIGAADTVSSVASKNKHFSIGSVNNPKLVFIEGGTFITPPNTQVSVLGMLYFLPSKQVLRDLHDHEILVEEQSVDLAGVRVNGAILSGYNCSYNATSRKKTQPHFFARYDKTILNTLYKKLGSVEVGSGYRIVAGSWRDF